MTKTIGLDVGGAHLKVAIAQDGKLVCAQQFACPLWRGLDQLDNVIKEAKPLTDGADQVAITMTGELSDLFETRKTGVHTLIDRLENEYAGKTRYWMGQRGFGTAQQAKTNHPDVGSTNFLATAQAVALHATDAILIDIGSTTTDIIPIIDAKPCSTGLTDAQRLQTGELVYTGITRTSVMAVANQVPFQGTWQATAREHLANMADIYRLLGELPEGIDNHDTADGRGKSFDESLTRFARILGRDADELVVHNANNKSDTHITHMWKPAAKFIANAQLRSIEDAFLQVLSNHPHLSNPEVITAGIGKDIALQTANHLAHRARSFGELLGLETDAETEVTHNAPAAAVALLAAQQ